MKTKRILFTIIGIVIIFGTTAFLLLWNGIVLFNNPSIEDFPVRGVDVSAYQGEIDWDMLSNQDISFAYIKATEGSSFVDENFSYNYSQAQNTDLIIGAYHFFSYDSSGKTQAENFIKNVSKIDKMLPPVIDLEFYGDLEKNPPQRECTQEQLTIMINELEAYYGIKPVIYATEKSYSLYLSNSYDDCDIWIRNVLTKPNISDNRDWTFWQYTNRGRLEGYNGNEKYIDINVFNGTKSDFERYCNNS